jgi:hypothetical protein
MGDYPSRASKTAFLPPLTFVFWKQGLFVHPTWKLHYLLPLVGHSQTGKFSFRVPAARENFGAPFLDRTMG